MMKRAFASLSLIALLAACGSVKPLRPAAGMSEVPKAAAAPERETAAQLMTPSTQAQPQRQSDLLTRSAEREVDPFDLAPGHDNGLHGNAAAPAN